MIEDNKLTTAELLARELHRQYRAAEKALTIGYKAAPQEFGLKHDHGWDGCSKQTYFLRRANLMVKRASDRAPSTLGQAEQCLDAALLILHSL